MASVISIMLISFQDWLSDINFWCMDQHSPQGKSKSLRANRVASKRLINAFEHQADLFLRRTSSLNNVAIHPVHNYTQYDQPDQPGASIGMESEHPTTPTTHFIPESDSDGSGMSPTNPADSRSLCHQPLDWNGVSHMECNPLQ